MRDIDPAQGIVLLQVSVGTKKNTRMRGVFGCQPHGIEMYQAAYAGC